MKVAIYTRISRDDKGTEAGVKRQEEDCRAWCAEHGHDEITVYKDDNISAMGGKHRPRYEAMIAGIKSGAIDAVVTWHQDRITRSPWEMEEYIVICSDRKGGTPTYTLNGGPLDLTTPEGRLQARFGVMIAQYYVEHNRANNLRAMEGARNLGERHGGRPPFGWVRTGKKQIAAVAAEIPHIRKCYEMCLAGDTYQAIANYMNDSGQVTRAGKPWTIEAVMRLLSQATHAGLIEHVDAKAGKHYYTKDLGEIFDGNWEGFIPRATWEAARQRIADPTRWRNSDLSWTANKRNTLLAGIMLCCVCGRFVTPDVGGPSRNGGRGKPAYKCNQNHVTINIDKADGYVVSQVLSLIRESKSVRAVTRLTAELARINAKLAETADMFREGEITRGQLQAISRPLRDRSDAIQTKIKAPKLPANAGTEEWWSGLSLAEQRAMVKDTATISLVKAHGKTTAVEKRVILDPL